MLNVDSDAGGWGWVLETPTFKQCPGHAAASLPATLRVVRLLSSYEGPRCPYPTYKSLRPSAGWFSLPKLGHGMSPSEVIRVSRKDKNWVRAGGHPAVVPAAMVHGAGALPPHHLHHLRPHHWELLLLPGLLGKPVWPQRCGHHHQGAGSHPEGR